MATSSCACARPSDSLYYGMCEFTVI